MPSHVAYVHWGFPAPLEAIEWDLSIGRDPGESVGEYLCLFNGTIDGAGCYLGLQTNVSRPDTGTGIGKGLIFSTWWSFDASNTRIAEEGFREMGTHEGRFVGVRRPYGWTVGDYRVSLSRADTEIASGRALDWFELTIEACDAPTGNDVRPVPVGPGCVIGELRFPRAHPDKPARIDPGGLAFLEVYSGARTWADITPWHVAVMAFGDHIACPSGRTEYPRFPHGQSVPNVNARYDGTHHRVELDLGTGVVRSDRPARWP